MKTQARLTLLLMTLLASSSLFTSCVAKSRLGMFIPGHIRSERSEGEIVTAHYCFVAKKRDGGLAPSTDGAGTEALSLAVPAGAVAAAASMVSDVVIDAAKAELLKEAERYEHAYDTRLLLTTEELKAEGIIVVTRWVDGKDSKSVTKGNNTANFYQGLIPDNKTPDNKTPNQEQIVPDPLDEQVVGGESEEEAIEKALLKAPAGKIPAAVLTMRIKAVESTGVYRLSGAKLWIDSIGAKVVSFGWANAARPWQWLGGLVLATDGQAEVTANMSAKALVKKDNVSAWVEIKPESAILSSTKVGLSKLPATFALGNNVGSWMALPQYTEILKRVPGSEEKIKVPIGFVVMEFSFVEKDTSNTKKYLTKTADSVEKRRGKLTEAIEGAIDR